MNPAGLVRRIPLAPHQLVEPVTPQRDLFVLAHLGLPTIDVAAWRLTIDGLVNRPCTLDLETIRRLPKRDIECFHQCAGFPRKPEIATRRIANVVWSGVDLAELLRLTGIRAEARFLWAYGLDHGDFEGTAVRHYVKDVPLTRLAMGDVLLAYEINGEPLSPEHGFPLRLVVPGYYGTNLVKWLCRLELADRRADGLFTTTLYNDPLPNPDGSAVAGTSPVWAAPPESVIVAPQPGSLPAREIQEIWGWAWAAAGVVRLEVSTDGGASWSVARLDQRQHWSWQRFAFPWRQASRGRFTLMARATDAVGSIQPMERARNAVHAVTVEVA